jgi:hypothetical protein
MKTARSLPSAREGGFKLVDDPFHRVVVGGNPTLVGQPSEQAGVLCGRQAEAIAAQADRPIGRVVAGSRRPAVYLAA